MLEPGRAIVVSIDWHRGQRLSILAVYAPNDHAKNREFWVNIRNTLERRADIPRPQVLMGDLNMVDSELDRFPAGLDNLLGADMSAEFRVLLTWLKLVDGWNIQTSFHNLFKVFHST